ncbi:hypothetical protein E3J79_00350 [Candidatus Dependentiae bacterium]|nr:MAG: hypothetical protein E3J79_00350 [Candidatus Dependentiae bacterium]
MWLKMVKKIFFIIIIFSLSFFNASQGKKGFDILSIYNKTNDDLFICFCNPSDYSSEDKEIYSLKEDSSVSIEKNNVLEDMCLVLFNKKYLSSRLFENKKYLCVVKLKELDNNCVYIIEDEQLSALDSFEWELFSVAKNYLGLCSYKEACKFVIDCIGGSLHFFGEKINEVRSEIKRKIRESFAVVRENPYRSTIGLVTKGNHICEEERRYVEARESRVKKALEIFLGRSLDGSYIPKIAFITSGGGYRALLGTLGSFNGADQIKLLDTIMYLAPSSGSAWLVALWMTLGCSISELKEKLIPKVKGLFRNINFKTMKLIFDQLIIKYSFDQKITFVDLFGAGLANSLLEDFGDKRHMVYISQQDDMIKNSVFPFPIYSSSSGSSDLREWWWYEFTPFEAGGYELGMFVPIWACGRKFNNGLSVDFALEQNLGFYMGTFGSGFAAQIQQLYDYFTTELKDDGLLRRMYSSIVVFLLSKIGKKRLSCAQLCNFTFGMPSSPIQHTKYLKLIDPAYVLNFAYPTISGKKIGRRPDILFFLDYSGNIEGAPELKKVSEYAQSKNFMFPPINVDGIDQSIISIFKDEDNSDVPLVIYMPRIKDDYTWEKLKNEEEFAKYKDYLDSFDAKEFFSSYAKTINFYYDDFEARQLCALMEFNMQASKEKIVESINWVIDKKTLVTPSVGKEYGDGVSD